MQSVYPASPAYSTVLSRITIECSKHVLLHIIRTINYNVSVYIVIGEMTFSLLPFFAHSTCSFFWHCARYIHFSIFSPILSIFYLKRTSPTWEAIVSIHYYLPTNELEPFSWSYLKALLNQTPISVTPYVLLGHSGWNFGTHKPNVVINQ